MGSNGTPEFGLAHLDVRQAERVMELPLVSPGASILIRPATEENAKYWAEQVRRSASLRADIAASRLSKNDGEIEKINDALRDMDRDIYPGRVVTDMRGIVDVDGNPVESTIDNIRAFLHALPDWMFDRIRDQCALNERFVQIPRRAFEESAKN